MLIVVMRPKVPLKDLGHVIKRIEGLGFKPHVSKDDDRTVIGVVGERNLAAVKDAVEGMDGVDQVVPVSVPFKLASREFQPEDTVIRVGGVIIGQQQVPVMAGPCAVESLDQLLESAQAVKAAGASVLRGGAYKPRTSPYSFQGLGPEGLEMLAKVREATGLPVVTEVLDTADVPLVAKYADILQIGARNMQNFSLLQEVGKTKMPVLLKRGMMSSLEELLMSAEYILSSGNSRVILCERGIRTFEKYTRNTLDITAVPVLKKLSHLPVMVDPSHATGKWELVGPAAKAAVAVGCDGLIIEVHPRPEEALSDGPQALRPETFRWLMEDLRKVAAAVGRTM